MYICIYKNYIYYIYKMQLQEVVELVEVVTAKHCCALQLIQNFIFDYHVQGLCEKPYRKLRALIRGTVYLIHF